MCQKQYKIDRRIVTTEYTPLIKSDTLNFAVINACEGDLKVVSGSVNGFIVSKEIQHMLCMIKTSYVSNHFVSYSTRRIVI